MKNVILTDRRREILSGEDREVSQNQRGNVRRDIQDRLKAAIFDLSFLHEHLPQKDLADSRGFAEGGEATAGPITWVRHNRTGLGGFVPDQFRGAPGGDWEGKVVPPGEKNIDHEVIRRFKSLTGPNKASPETQEALIDTIAFLCRIAEAGELKISDLVEQGVDRYFENRSDRHPNEAEKTVHVSVRPLRSAYNAARRKELRGEELTGIERKVMRSELRKKDR